MKNYPPDFYKVIIENMNDGYAYHKIITNDAGLVVDFEFIEVNRAFEKLTGLKREDVMGRLASSISPGIKKEMMEWLERHGKLIYNDSQVEFEDYSAVFKRWYRVNVFVPEPGYFIAVFNDISDIKVSTEKLKANQEKWQFALESSCNGVWDWNVLTNEVHFSPMCKKMLGYEAHEMDDGSLEWDKWIHPEDKEQAEIAMDRHLAGQTPYYRSEHRLLGRDGNYKWILDCGQVYERTRDGQPLRVVGTHSDINQQKHDHEALLESETLHRNLIALSPDPIAILQHGKYQMISDSFTQLFGFTAQDIQMGLNFFQLVREQDRAVILKRYQERLAGALLPKTYAIDLKAKDGTWIPCETSSSLIQYKGGSGRLGDYP